MATHKIHAQRGLEPIYCLPPGKRRKGAAAQWVGLGHCTKNRVVAADRRAALVVFSLGVADLVEFRLQTGREVEVERERERAKNG